jgi:hypothetical protein
MYFTQYIMLFMYTRFGVCDINGRLRQRLCRFCSLKLLLESLNV